MGFRRAAWVAVAVAWVLAAPARDVVAAPEVHRLNLILSSNPSQVTAGDFNDFINDYNRLRLEPKGLESLEEITFAWYHQAEVRYFVRPNVSVSAGFGQIRSTKRQEYLPRIAQSIVVTTDLISVPVHVGGAYYLAPYTQGDFQARAYLGGGFLSLTNNKIVFERMEFATDSATTLEPSRRPGSERWRGRRDGPGYYFEAGAHMFFASRYSVLVGGIYRSAAVRNLRIVRDVIDPRTGKTVTQIPGDSADQTLGFDVGGLGIRMAVAIGF